MSWKTQKSLERIFNTFKRLKNNIYDKDIEALKQLNNELANAQKTYVNDNILFAKLVCYVLKMNLEHYGDINKSKKELSFILKMSLNSHIDMLRISLNNTDITNYFANIGADINDIGKDESEVISKHQSEIIKKLMSNWPFEVVEKSLYNTANDHLKDMDNYA